MNKLEMAQDFAKIILDAGLRGDWDMINLDSVAADAFLLADAMQAEADKRKIGDAKDELIGSRALQQTFIDGIEQPRYSDEQWRNSMRKRP